jgi:hypothetical protein
MQLKDLLHTQNTILQNMFDNSKEFSLYIEKIVKEKRISHMDAVLYYCKENFIEPEDIKKLINKSLRDKIKVNATELNYFPKPATLDLDV